MRLEDGLASAKAAAVQGSEYIQQEAVAEGMEEPSLFLLGRLYIDMNDHMALVLLVFSFVYYYCFSVST